ncbi:MAG: DUF3489 domain-containing protein, partial [Amphiplicatus sp.]
PPDRSRRRACRSATSKEASMTRASHKATETKKPKSKSDAILELLRRKNGATVKDMMKATGWMVHSVRGFLSGTVRKKRGFDLRTERSANGVLRYYLNAAQ